MKLKPTVTRTAVTSTLAAVVAAGTVLLAASPAAAHDAVIVVSGGYGQLLQQHTTVRACDTRDDQVTIRVDVRTSAGASGSVTDMNGATAGCGQVFLIAGTVTLWRVCAGAACTPWMRS